MTVLQVVAPGTVGGLERVVQMLSRGLLERRHRVVVVAVGASRSDTEPFAGPLEAGGVEVVRIVVGARRYLKEKAAIARLCTTYRPTVVHTHGYRPDILGGAAARLQGSATVTTVHGYTGGDWKNRLYELAQRRALRRFAAVVAVSEPLRQALKHGGVHEDRLHVIPNAWDGDVEFLDRHGARSALGLPEDSPVVGWVGRLSPEKAPDALLDAIPFLSDIQPVMSILGDGSQHELLVPLAKQWEDMADVRLHGTVANADRLYRAFDCFVLSSRTEGTPIVLFEAMAAGVPIVATRVGGVPDVVGDAEAVLVDPGDPIALADAIRRTLSDREAALARAARAQQRLESDYGLDAWLDAYEDVYARVASVTPLESNR